MHSYKTQISIPKIILTHCIQNSLSNIQYGAKYKVGIVPKTKRRFLFSGIVASPPLQNPFQRGISISHFLSITLFGQRVSKFVNKFIRYQNII